MKVVEPGVGVSDPAPASTRIALPEPVPSVPTICTLSSSTWFVVAHEPIMFTGVEKLTRLLLSDP